MAGGAGRYKHFQKKIIETLALHPYITIFTAWLVVYVPLLILIGINFEEDNYTVVFDREDIFATNETVWEYSDNENDTMLFIRFDGNDSKVNVLVPKGYIPIRLELVNYSKIYTSSPYDDNRTWDIYDGEIRHIRENGKNTSWKVEIYKKETDAPFYKDRGETLLEGRMIYRDVPTLNPPLINLFWILPALAGGSFLIFRIYFAFFALISAFMVMRTFWPDGKWRSVVYGSMFLLNPLTVYSTIGAVQDDIIVAFLFVLTVHAVVRKRGGWASVLIGAGMATKVFHLLMMPGVISEREKFIFRLIKIFLALVVVALILAPVTYLSPDGVATFAKLYFTGDSGGELQGISLWKYLGEIGYYPFINTALIVLLGLGLMLITFSKEFGMLNTSILFILLFLIMFPKVHSGYYLMILAFIPVFWRIRFSKTILFLSGTFVIALDLINGLGWNENELVFIPIIISACLMACLVHFFISAYKRTIEESRRNRRARI
jgi:hypothetical protein